NILVIISSLTCLTVSGECSVARVEANSQKQVNNLINRYDDAINEKERTCQEQALRDLLVKLEKQNAVFGQAMNEEVSGGELEASIVNEQEQVDLQKAIKLLKDKLTSLDAQKVATTGSSSRSVRSSRGKRRSRLPAFA